MNRFASALGCVKAILNGVAIIRKGPFRARGDAGMWLLTTVSDAGHDATDVSSRCERTRQKEGRHPRQLRVKCCRRKPVGARVPTLGAKPHFFTLASIKTMPPCPRSKEVVAVEANKRVLKFTTVAFKRLSHSVVDSRRQQHPLRRVMGPRA